MNVYNNDTVLDPDESADLMDLAVSIEAMQNNMINQLRLVDESALIASRMVILLKGALKSIVFSPT